MITPYYDDGNGIQIYCGDCREILPQLDVKADLVLTDPPYGISQEDNGLRELTYTFNDNPNLVFEILPRLLVAPVIYIWCAAEQLSFLLAEFVKADFMTRKLAWIKQNPPVINGQHIWLSSFELCAYGKQAGALHKGNCLKGYFIDSPDSQRFHQTQKPLRIISEQIQASTNTGGLILEPFLGSGTTAVAAKILGRKCIGIEIEEKYCKIAVERLRQSVMRLDV